MACRVIRNKNTNEIEQVLAPNGSESLLYKSILSLPNQDKETALRLWAQVYTPSFKKWFGDWEEFPLGASKVVDENGEPLVVYHGSSSESIDVFSADFSRENAIYFTPQREYADEYRSTAVYPERAWFFTLNNWKYYAEDDNKVYYKLDLNDNRIDIEQEEYEKAFEAVKETGKVYPVFLNIKSLEKGEDLFFGKPRQNFVDEGFETLSTEGGITYNIYGVFDSNQVKSVLNEGNFDPLNDSIYYYGNAAKVTEFAEEVTESNKIFESQIDKLNKATNGTLVEGRKMSKETLNDILDDILSKGPRQDYDHIGIDFTTGVVHLYNSKSPEANERAKRAAKLLEDLTLRTGLKYQIDYYLPTPGEFREGKVIINPYHPKFGTDVVWHEAIGHPIVEAVFQSAENSNLYNTLKSQIDENVGGIQEFMAEEYPEYEVNSDPYYKEAITTLLGRYMAFANGSVETVKVKQEISTESAVIKFLDRFLARVKNILNDIIKIYNESTKKISIADLKDKNFTIQELATILGATQNYIDLTDVNFKDKFFSTTSTISELEQAVLDAQTQGVQKSIDDQLQTARQQIIKQFKVLKNKLNPEDKKTLLRIQQYLEDPSTFGKIRTFSTYLAETERLLKYYLDDGKKIAREVKDVRDKITQLSFVLQVAESYEPTINALENEYLYVDDSNEIKKVIRSSKSLITDIKALYAREVEGPIADILADSAKTVADDVIEQLDNDIRFIEGRLARREANTPEAKALVKRLAELRRQREQLVPNRENILAVMKGQRGDANMLSMWLEATIGTGDLTVASFAKFIKDLFNDVRRRMLPLRNRAQEQLDSYRQATGRSNLNNADFYEGLYELVPRLEQNEDGSYVIKEYYALVGQFNQQYIVDQQKFYNELNQLKKEGKTVEYREKQAEFEAWKSKYMEREFTEAYYDAEKLLIPEARVAQQDLLNQITILKDLIKANGGSIDDSEELDVLWTQYTDLGRTFDRLGKKKTGQDLAIAESIQAFRAARREMETHEFTEQGKVNFEAVVKQMQDRVTSGQITQEQYERWLLRNTTRRIHPDFYLARNKITKRISDILEKVPPEIIGKESNDELWEAIFAISANHRDFDRIPDGRDLVPEELSVVKGNQEVLEDKRLKTISLGGLSPSESLQLNALYNSESLDADVYEEISSLLALKKSRKAEIEKYISSTEYQLLLDSYNELREIQKSVNTAYYDETYAAELDAFLATRPDLENASDELITMNFERSKWFTDNHILKTVPIFSDGSFSHYDEVWEPLYIWRDTIPVDETLIDYNYPSFKYLERIVKPEFRNPNFRDTVDGYNIPKLEIEENGVRIKSPYVNKKYEELRDKSQSNSSARAQWDMLQFLTQTYNEGQEKLPMERRMGLLLPAIEKDAVDRWQAEGIANTGRQALEGLKRKFSVVAQDKDTALGDVSGMEFSYIPVKYTGTLDKDSVNLNLLESIMRFRLGSEEYSILEQSLPVAEGLQKIVDDDTNRISTGKIDVVLKKLGFNVEVLKRGKSNRGKQINEFIKSVWYGELQKDEHIGNISINKVTNNLMGVASLQILALNFPAHTTNWISGNIQSYIEANANQYFGKADWVKAKKVYASNIKNFWQDYRKEGKKSLLTQLVERYDVPQGQFEDEFGQKTDYSNLREGKGWLFFTKNAGEHEIQVSTFIAMASKKMVKKGDSMIPLMDAYELDANGDLQLKEGVEFETQQENDFTGKVHGLLKGLNGNYNKFDRPLIEKYSIGRLISFMRKYLVPMATRRFGGTRLNMELGEINEGYYLTFARTMVKDLRDYRGNILARWDDLSEKEKQSVRRTIMDIGLISIFAILITLLGGYDEDRDITLDEDGLARLTYGKFWKTHLLYQLMKVKSETENFLPLPGFGYDEALRTFKTTSIAWRSLEQISGVFDQLVYLSVNSDKAYYDRDQGVWEEGDIKLLAKLGKMAGYSGNMSYPELMIKNFELGQKVK